MNIFLHITIHRQTTKVGLHIIFSTLKSLQ